MDISRLSVRGHCHDVAHADGCELREVLDPMRRHRLYDARSKYVHEGRAIPETEILEAESVAMEVLWALLAVSGAGTLATTSEWLKKIDYVLAALRDGRVIPDEDFQSVGIAKSGVARVPPNHIAADAFDEN